MNAIRRHLAALGVFLALGGGGCVLLERMGLVETRRAFSHAIHVGQEEIECEACHSKAGKGLAAGMPEFKKCQVCHEGVDEDLPPERRLAAVYGEDPQWSYVTALSSEVKFSHKVHTAGAKLECSACHRDMENNTGVSEELRMSMEECMACHAQPEQKASAARGYAENDCVVCHRDVRRDVRPAGHDRNWMRLHGQQVREDDGAAQGRCNLCHDESSCSTCHREQAPANHTLYWRDRGHGVAVRFDRGSCTVCHQTDSCDRCHSETEPRSHAGNWGGRLGRHCLACHFSREEASCVMCHGTPTHPDAPPKPDWHLPDFVCSDCHVPVPHPDPGLNCNTCHH